MKCEREREKPVVPVELDTMVVLSSLEAFNVISSPPMARLGGVCVQLQSKNGCVLGTTVRGQRKAILSLSHSFCILVSLNYVCVHFTSSPATNRILDLERPRPTQPLRPVPRLVALLGQRAAFLFSLVLFFLFSRLSFSLFFSGRFRGVEVVERPLLFSPSRPRPVPPPPPFFSLSCAR